MTEPAIHESINELVEENNASVGRVGDFVNELNKHIKTSDAYVRAA